MKVININLPVGHDILEKCRPLYEYSWFVQKVKEYTEQLQDRDAAIEQAIRDCIQAGIFKNFVRKLQKGKIAEQIAEELEEPLENIIQICAVMEECGLDAETQEIYKHIYCMETN